MRVARKILVVVAGCVGGMMMSACTGGADTATASPWADDIRALGQESEIELVQGVTEDGGITQAEFEEVQQAYISCHEDRGFPIEVRTIENGLWSYRGTGAPVGDGAAWEKVGKECSQSSGLLDIEPLYGELFVNPDREDFGELVVECLVDIEAVDRSYTAENYREDIANAQEPYSGDPVDVQTCLANPRLLLKE